MGSLTISNSMELDRLRQSVWVNGVLRPDVHCLSVDFGLGTQGSRASFVLPALDWDEGKQALRGARVQVSVGYSAGTRRTVWAGWLDRVRGSTSSRVVEVEGLSAVGYAHRVYIGQDGGLMDVRYPSAAYKDGVLTATGWKTRDILRDWFNSGVETWKGGGGAIPSGWRALLKLGNLGVLGSYFNDFPVGDLSFQQATLTEGLDKVLEILGTVSFRERFDGAARTYLDFFELASLGSGVRRVVVARPGESVAGTNALSISDDEALSDVRNRLIAVGSARLFMVSTSTEHATAPLVKAWDASLEAGVLANPEGSKKGNESGDAGDEARAEFTEAKALVFRRYRLPAVFRSFDVQRDNALTLSDGSTLPIQVWQWPRVLTKVGDSLWTGTPAAAPVLLEGVQFDLENLTFTLKEPAMNVVSATINGSNEFEVTYEEAVVGITLSLADRERLTFDSGVAGHYDLPGLEGDGLTELVINESFRAHQVNGTRGGHVFNSCLFYLQGTGWVETVGVESLRDDSATLRFIGRAALKEKRAPRKTYSVSTPFWTNSFKLGDRIAIVGQDDFRHGTHQIRSLRYSLTHDHRTEFSTDDQVPEVMTRVLGEE